MHTCECVCVCGVGGWRLRRRRVRHVYFINPTTCGYYHHTYILLKWSCFMFHNFIDHDFYIILLYGVDTSRQLGSNIPTYNWVKYTSETHLRWNSLQWVSDWVAVTGPLTQSQWPRPQLVDCTNPLNRLKNELSLHVYVYENLGWFRSFKLMVTFIYL